MPPDLLAFGPFQLDERSHALQRDGDPVPVTDRHARLLILLASSDGRVISKDALVAAGWGDVAVTDNSVEQAISLLRRALGRRADGGHYIETIPRRGYRFAADVRRVVARVSDATLEALLDPHRAWLEGRAALETLERDQVIAAHDAFTRVLAGAPDYGPAHVGLANACAFRFESTRIDERPDAAALAQALQHAREACRLDTESAEAWATLGFILHRAGDPQGAIAAARRAVSIEPDNWRHHLRLATVGWGEERLRAAGRATHLLPGLALAHWLAATVHVARQAFDMAEHEIDAGAAAQDQQRAGTARFSAVGLHWLRGLVRLQRGDTSGARDSFDRELSFEQAGHLYARECCANTWYALGALSRRQGQPGAAKRAFDEAVQRAGGHFRAIAGRTAMLDGPGRAEVERLLEPRLAALRAIAPVDHALAVAVRHALDGEHGRAAAAAEEVLTGVAPSPASWILPVEPILDVSAHRDRWAAALALLRAQAA